LPLVPAVGRSAPQRRPSGRARSRAGDGDLATLDDPARNGQGRRLPRDDLEAGGGDAERLPRIRGPQMAPAAPGRSPRLRPSRPAAVAAQAEAAARTRTPTAAGLAAEGGRAQAVFSSAAAQTSA